MRLNDWSIAYGTARIFAGVRFGSSTASLLEVWMTMRSADLGSYLKQVVPVSNPFAKPPGKRSWLTGESNVKPFHGT
jgi:hypothetical protein